MSPAMSQGLAMVSDEDQERAEAYTLIGHLFKAPASIETLEFLREFEGDDSPLGKAVGGLAAAARAASVETVDTEYGELFIAATEKTDTSPYAAVHRSGSHFGQALIDLREDLSVLGIAKREDELEPEDHVSALCEVMAGLIAGRLGRPADAEQTAVFFRKHLKPWMADFVRAVSERDAQPFYAAVGRFACLFLDNEIRHFR
jgi:TorA maturation chaperone TorD